MRERDMRRQAVKDILNNEIPTPGYDKELSEYTGSGGRGRADLRKLARSNRIKRGQGVTRRPKGRRAYTPTEE